MATFSVRNWDTYQHYTPKPGSLPAWLKLHLSITTHIAWIKGSNLARLLMIGSILLAGRYKNSIEVDEDVVSRGLGLREKWSEVLLELRYLSSREFIELDETDSIQPIASRADAPSREEEKKEDSEENPPKPPKGASRPEGFNAWYLGEGIEGYDGYPHKVAVDGATRAWEKRRKAGTLPSVEVLIAATKAYVAKKPADVPYANPATWLNGGRWQDEPAPIPAAGIPSTEPTIPRVKDESFWRENLPFFKRTKIWPTSWGPEPGYGGCEVPPHLIAEFNLDGLTQPAFLRRSA